MSARSIRRLCAVAPLLLLCAGLHRAGAAWHEAIATDTDSGVTINVSSPFEDSPPGGCMPLWITIYNNSGAARTWNITCDGSGAGFGLSSSKSVSNGSFRVENGQTARAFMLMPLVSSQAGYYYGNHFVRVEGYAVNDVQSPVPTVNATGKGTNTHVVGMSEALATPIWTSLTKWYTDHGEDLMGSPVDLTLLGGDWRELIGFDSLWLTDADYLSLDAARRTAIQDWIVQGGQLFVCAQNADPSLRAAVGLTGNGGESDAGLGHVQWLPWDGKPLPLETVSGDTDKIRSVRDDPSFARADWPMTHDVGHPSINAPFLICFIIVFAVVVGPLNLFVFASATRRHRLFWTTPAISVAASLLLLIFIVLKDGFGGNGERAMFCLLLPDQKKAVILQEQVARTGVLFAREFTTAENLVLTPLQTGSTRSRNYEQAGRDYSGDWFASRSGQAQRAEAVVPSRAEIQLLNADAARDGAPPVVTSSIPAALKEIRYLDAAGKHWRGGDLRTGESITLRADPQPGEQSAGGGSTVLDTFRNGVAARPGYFVAYADDGPFFETLSSIHWNKERAVFAGLVSPVH